MAKMHKHSGVARSDTGALRNHPVTQTHKDPKVKAAHNRVLKVKPKIAVKSRSKVKLISRSKIKRTKQIFSKSKSKIKTRAIKGELRLPIDADGYVYVDLTQMKQIRGARVKFVSIEGRTKKTVGIQLENKR